MTIEQLERAKEIQRIIETEKKKIEHLEELGSCEELIIVQSTLEVKNRIKEICYDTSIYAPRYVSGEEVKLLVEALSQPSQDEINKSQAEFNAL